MYKIIHIYKIAVLLFVGVLGLLLSLLLIRANAQLVNANKSTAELKNQLEAVSREFEDYRVKSKETEMSSGKQVGEIRKLKEDRKELIEKVLGLEKQKTKFENDIASHKEKLSNLEQDVAPLADLRSKLSATEEELNTARSELESLRRSEKAFRARSEKRPLAFEDGSQGLEQNYTKFVETEWLYNLSKAAEMKGELDKKLAEIEAKETANRKMMKEIADMHYNLAVVLTNQKKTDEAILEYEKVLSINPTDADCHYNLAVLYDREKGNPKKALEHYRAYVQHKPDAADAQKVRKWIVDKEIELKLTA